MKKRSERVPKAQTHRDLLIMRKVVFACVVIYALIFGQILPGTLVLAEGPNKVASEPSMAAADKDSPSSEVLVAKASRTGEPTAAAEPSPDPEPTPEPNPTPKTNRGTRRSFENFGPFDYEQFLAREKAGEFPSQSGDVPVISQLNSLTNNNGGAEPTRLFTQSETCLIAFGNNVVVGFNDSGSNAGGTNKFTGWAYSNDGGTTFTDGGTLPTNPGGDAGDPVLARDDITGRIYFSTLGFSTSTIQMFRSDDNGVTWMPPVNATPGGSDEDKQWHTVDNYPGAGNGNVYMLSRRFGTPGPGIYFYRSTNGGDSFEPNGGVNIVSGAQGAFIAVAPDHSIYAFWFGGAGLRMRKSTDFGATFGPTVNVNTFVTPGGTNGDLGLTGVRNGTATPSSFRSSRFPHAAVNPINGHIYVTYNDRPAVGGTDKSNVYIVTSVDGGATWGAPIQVNDDETTTDQWMPTIAVSTDGSRLGVFYYSRQEDPVNNNLFKFYGSVGTINGSNVSFLPSFPVSDEPSFPEFGRDSLINATYMSDYDFAVATPGYFHVSWSDSRFDLEGGAPRKDPNVFYKKIPLGLAVASTVPQVGSIISNQPTQFTVNVTDPVDPATLSAGDFSVNGISANSVVYAPGSTTLVFSFNASPVTSQGLQTMHVAAGAFNRAEDGEAVIEFTGTFRYDLVTLQVTSTAPPFPGGTFLLPNPLTYDVTFNEPIDPASVQAGDLTLSGIAGSSVTDASVLPGNTTVRFTLNIPSEGIITASIGGGSITDQFGNPGTPFSASYGVDIETQPFPVPLVAKNPYGSLIYDPTASGTIGHAGDTDTFTVDLDPNQTVTVVVNPTTPGLRPTVSVRNPANAVVGTGSASGAGNPALLNTAPAVAGGTYSIDVSGLANSTGNYTVDLILNSAKETEGVTGGSNNARNNAQNIDASFITLNPAHPGGRRGAVGGTVDPAPYTAAPVTFGFEDISATGTVIAGLTNQDDASVSIPIGFGFNFYGVTQANVFVSSNGLMTFGTSNTGFTNADLTTAPTQAAIAPFWDDLHTGGGQPDSGVRREVKDAGTANERLIVQWNQVRFFSGGTAGDTLTFQAVLYADGRVRFNYQDIQSGSAAGNNGGSATAGIKASGTQGPDRLLLAFNNGPNAFVDTGKSSLISPPDPTPDFYSFTLAGGDTVTLGVKGTSLGVATVELQNSSGTVLATGAGGPTNLDRVLTHVVPSYGTYYARVAGDIRAPYNLVVTRNVAFDTEDNNSLETAQPLAGNRGVLGASIRSGAYAAATPSFDFEDISGTGTQVAFSSQDDGATSIPIGFGFPFFGTNHADVFVSTNGLMTFGAGNTAFTNADLTTAPPQAAIAPFWDDLHLDSGAAGAGVYYQVLGSGTDERLVVQWNNVRYFTGSAAGDGITFQAVLYANGTIRLNYLDLVSGTSAGNNGASATVGVKAAGSQGVDRLLLAFNNGPNAFVGTGQSTSMSQPPADDWYSVTLRATQTTLEVYSGTPGDGPGEFVNTLDPHIELYGSDGSLIASGTPTGDGRNESIVANGLAGGGTYYVRVSSDFDTRGEYTITTGDLNFGGLLPPISTTGLNQTQAGSTVSVRFSLGGFQGFDILWPVSPVSQRINCDTFAPIGGEEPTAPNGNAGLAYDAEEGHYRYIWTTNKAWKNTCRELNVKLIDGTDQKAKFRFK